MADPDTTFGTDQKERRGTAFSDLDALAKQGDVDGVLDVIRQRGLGISPKATLDRLRMVLRNFSGSNEDLIAACYRRMFVTDAALLFKAQLVAELHTQEAEIPGGCLAEREQDEEQAREALQHLMRIEDRMIHLSIAYATVRHRLRLPHAEPE